MVRINYIFFATLTVLFVGCAHSPADVQSSESLSSTNHETIAVYVGGAVNKPGKQNLGYPFIIEHAIQQAGGVDEFEKDWNRKVLVRHRNGQQIFVDQKDYGSFMLMDGDAIAVPRS